MTTSVEKFQSTFLSTLSVTVMEKSLISLYVLILFTIYSLSQTSLEIIQ